MNNTSALLRYVEEQSGNLPWWAWVLILLLFILLLAWIVRNWFPEKKEKAAPVKTETVERSAPAAHVEAAPSAFKPDDLTIIEGIGPKIDSVLKQAGIKTLAQLGNTPASKVEEIIRAAGIRLGDPTTWPEQARLASKGDLEGLQKLQDSLKGGRRA